MTAAQVARWPPSPSRCRRRDAGAAPRTRGRAGARCVTRTRLLRLSRGSGARRPRARIGCRAREDRSPEGDRRGRAPRRARARRRAQAGRPGPRGRASSPARAPRPGSPTRCSRRPARRSATAPGAPTSSPRSRRRRTTRSRALGPDSVLVGFLAPLTNGAGNQGARRDAARPRSRWRRSRASRAPSRWTRCPRRPPSRGYRAVLIAAQEQGRFFPMLMTAAGTIPPAQVLVLGAGVAGPAGDRHRAPARRASSPASTCAPRSRSRSSRSARSSSRSRARPTPRERAATRAS